MKIKQLLMMVLVTGLTVTTWAQDYNFLNGKKVQIPGLAEAYLVDQGQKRWIPNYGTLLQLFANPTDILFDLDVMNIPVGTQITDGAFLATCLADGKVYLIDNQMKRHIANPSVMNKYGFDWNKIQDVNCLALSFIQTGPQIH